MPRPLAILMLLVTTLIWGFAFSAQKSGMATMGPLTFTATRFLLGGLVVLPLALREYHKRGIPLTGRQWRQLLGLCAAFFMGTWLQQTGLTMTTVTNAGFLTALYVLFVPLIAFIVQRTRPHPIVWLCVPLALIGTYYLNGGEFGRFNLGDLLMVFGAVFWAVHVLMLSHIARDTGLPMFVSSLTFLFAGAVALVLVPFLETPSFAGISAGWVQLAYSGVFATALAFTMQAIGQQYVPPANAAIILSAESLFAALGGALVLGERLPPIGYAGAALIFAAIVLVETVPMLVARGRPSEQPAGGV
jgi:drug/metabolite transporter (DMT)-like permease